MHSPPSSGEIESPERTLPRALALAIVSVVVCTGLPMLVAAGNDRFWRCWEEGSINAVMAQLCGPWLGIWAVISSAVCRTEPNPWTRTRQRTALFRHAPWIAQVGNYGMFSAEFLEDTHQLEGMACVGLAPRIFQTRSKRFGTPVNAMLFQLVLLVFLVGLDFRAILCAPAVPAEPSLPHALHSRAPEPRSSFLLGASTISSRPSQICSSSLRAYRCAIASLTCLAPSASGVRIGWSWP